MSASSSGNGKGPGAFRVMRIIRSWEANLTKRRFVSFDASARCSQLVVVTAVQMLRLDASSALLFSFFFLSHFFFLLEVRVFQRSTVGAQMYRTFLATVWKVT